MKILYLCDKKYWENKMSRVRFHAMDAIAKHSDVELFKDGSGWEGFVSARQSEIMYQPDLIVWYKPLDIPGYSDINTPACLRYNEMYDVSWTTEEIVKSNSKLVICHHANDIPHFDHIKRGAILRHNPHCAEKEIFKDYGLTKDIDVLLTGRISPVYPFRRRLQALMQTHLKPRGLSCVVQPHPGYRIPDVEKQVIEYAKLLSRAKIVLTCSSKYKYALAKYSEIPLCGSILCADIPEENQEWYKKWMLHVSDDMTDDEIADRIINADMGSVKGFTENQAHRTQENYAEKFVQIVREFL